jgi:glycosyltransferase involved in cell wall biosynthesis
MQTDLLVFYDNEIEEHFPPHFKDVYLYKLREEHGLNTSVVAMSSKYHAELPAGYEMLWKKKSPNTFWRRFIYSLHHAYRVMVFCMFNRKFRSARNILVHNDPILCILVTLLAPGKTNIIYRTTHLKYEEVLHSGSSRQARMAIFAMQLRSTAIKRSDKVIVMSESMRGHFLDSEKDLSDNKVVAVESMIDAEIEFESEDIDSEISDFASKGFVMVYVGTLALSRDLQQILDVVAEVIKRHNKAKLLILGQGDAMQLRQSIDHMGIGGHVMIVDALPEPQMLKVISECDLGISHYPFDRNPAFKHNSPLKLLNYIQSGIPVVGTDIPDQVLVLSEAGKGILVENSRDEYVNAINKIILQLKKYIPDTDKDVHWLKENRSIEVAARKIAELCN